MARAPSRPTPPAGGRRLPIDPAPALSLAGLVIIAIVSFGLLGGNLPALPGSGNGNGGPIRTPTPSNVIIVPPVPDVPGTFLYVKDGNIWTQAGGQVTAADEPRADQDDSMPTWSPDGASIYFVRTTEERGTWLSSGVPHDYNLQIPRLLRLNADGSGDAGRPAHGSGPERQQHVVVLHP